MPEKKKLKKTGKKKTSLRTMTYQEAKRDPTLDELLEAGLPIFTTNNSNPLGNVAVLFTEQASGKRFPITIPATDLPIQISNRVPKNAIDQAVDFRGLLEKRMLRLAWPADAQTRLADPDAQEELRELFASKHAGSGGSGVSRFSADAAADAVKEERKNKKKMLENMSIEDDDGDDFRVDARVQGMMVQLDEDTITEARAKRKLRAWAPHLKEDDLNYVIQRSAKSTDLKKMARSLLKQKQEGVTSEGGSPIRDSRYEGAVSS